MVTRVGNLQKVERETGKTDVSVAVWSLAIQAGSLYMRRQGIVLLA
jgi:hypothetical protein